MSTHQTPPPKRHAHPPASLSQTWNERAPNTTARAPVDRSRPTAEEKRVTICIPGYPVKVIKP